MTNINFKSIFLGFLAGPFAAVIVAMANNYLAVSLIPVIFTSLSSGINWINGYFLISNFLINAAFALLGGYVAGRVAKQDEYLYAVAIATLGVLATIGLSMLTAQKFNLPSMQVSQVLKLLLTTIPYAMVGAYLSHAKNIKEDIN